MRRALLLAVPLLMLGACVTTTDKSSTYDLVGAAQDNVQLGAHYLQIGDLQAAKDKLDKAEKQDPRNRDVYRMQALLSEQLNQPKEAARYYQKALNLTPDSPELVNTYAVFLCKQGDVDSALPMFEKVIADKLYSQPWVPATNAAVCLRGQKRDADAQRYFERAVAMNPLYEDAVVFLADLQIDQGKPADAFKTAQNYLATGKKQPDVLVIAVRASVAQHECGNAQLYARQLARDYPNSPQASQIPQVLSVCASYN
jgi:type IV pilus assembly protein PilF